MTVIFTKLFSLSLNAGAIVLLVLLIRALFPRLSKRVCVLLWGIVALRLLLPIYVESPVGLFLKQDLIAVEDVKVWTPILQTLVEQNVFNEDNLRNGFTIGVSQDLFSTAQIPVIRTGIKAVDEKVDQGITRYLAPSVGKKLAKGWNILSYVWVCGMFGMFLYAAFRYCHMKRITREAIPYDCNNRGKDVFLVEGIPTAFLLGLIHPRIYLPASIDRESVEMVLRHERIHRKHGDHLWKVFAYALLSVYWFQPLLWIAFAIFCLDVEYFCDETVILELDELERAGYAETLLTLSAEGTKRFVCPVCFSESDVSKRVRRILNHKKKTVFAGILSAVLLVVVLCCALTNRRIIPEYEKARAEKFFQKEWMYTDDAAVERYLTNLPEDAESLRKAGVFLKSESTDPDMRKLWNDFAERVNSRKNGMLTIAYFTDEGDPIFYYLYFDGEQFYYRYDNSRDYYGMDPAIHPAITARYLWAQEQKIQGRYWNQMILSDVEGLDALGFLNHLLSSFYDPNDPIDYSKVYFFESMQKGEGDLQILWE